MTLDNPILEKRPGDSSHVEPARCSTSTTASPSGTTSRQRPRFIGPIGAWPAVAIGASTLARPGRAAEQDPATDRLHGSANPDGAHLGSFFRRTRPQHPPGRFPAVAIGFAARQCSLSSPYRLLGTGRLSLSHAAGI